MRPINGEYIAESGLIAVDVVAADDETAPAFQ
ncbi:DUF6207 family protein [Streptomyces sp. NPDC059928]